MLTRCPYCGTTFRVTPEQLKIRQGQVRCGQCRRVFDALRALDENPVKPQSAARSSTPRTPEPAPAPPPPPVRETTPSVEGLSWSIIQPAPPGVDQADHEPLTITGFDYVPTQKAEPVGEPAVELSHGFQPVTAFAEDESAENPEPQAKSSLRPTPEVIDELPPDDDVEFEHAPVPGAPVDIELDVEPHTAEPAPAPEAEPAPEPEPGPESEPEAEPEPDRQPESEAAPTADPRPHLGPGRRPANPPTIFELHTPQSLVPEPTWHWVVGGVIAALAIVGQLMMHYRTDIIAQSPNTKPLFVAACELFGCQITLPHKIDLIGIDASDLAPDEKRPGTLHLTATLRNRASFPQAWPHLEVTLTDAQERPLLRRALAPSEYLPAEAAAGAGFPARADQLVQLTLTAADVPAVGYRLYVFYP
jgi:predicted Zn finger-like uncharacterized protein